MADAIHYPEAAAPRAALERVLAAVPTAGDLWALYDEL